MRKDSLPLPKMLRGVLCPQWVRCGRRNCHCASGNLHGPYFYLFWREQGRLRKRYVKPAEVQHVRACCELRRVHRQQLSASQDEWRRMADMVRQMEKQ
jgi:hypothetical protein